MNINYEAPATACAEAHVHAPVELVWSVQADIAGWPEWNSDVASVDLRGPVEPGTEFRWKAGGLPIISILQEVSPERRLAWTGRTMGIRAIHVWTFEAREDGVLVRTEESFEGLVVRLFAAPLRRMLKSSLENGIAALKAECERRTV